MSSPRVARDANATVNAQALCGDLPESCLSEPCRGGTAYSVVSAPSVSETSPWKMPSPPVGSVPVAALISLMRTPSSSATSTCRAASISFFSRSCSSPRSGCLASDWITKRTADTAFSRPVSSQSGGTPLPAIKVANSATRSTHWWRGVGLRGGAVGCQSSTAEINRLRSSNIRSPLEEGRPPANRILSISRKRLAPGPMTRTWAATCLSGADPVSATVGPRPPFLSSLLTATYRPAGRRTRPSPPSAGGASRTGRPAGMPPPPYRRRCAPAACRPWCRETPNRPPPRPASGAARAAPLWGSGGSRRMAANDCSADLSSTIVLRTSLMQKTKPERRGARARRLRPNIT